MGKNVLVSIGKEMSNFNHKMTSKHEQWQGAVVYGWRNHKEAGYGTKEGLWVHEGIIKTVKIEIEDKTDLSCF